MVWYNVKCHAERPYTPGLSRGYSSVFRPYTPGVICPLLSIDTAGTKCPLLYIDTAETNCPLFYALHKFID